MKKSDKDKSAGDGYWFTRDNRGGRYCDLPVATRAPKGSDPGEHGSRPRKAARRLYAKLLRNRATTVTSFKAWLRAQS
jgi:hypothetical protein